MIIVGLQNCAGCKTYRDMHPEYEYVEFRRGSGKTSDRVREVKKALLKLKFNGRFPALLTDDMNELTPRNKIAKEFD